MLIKVPAKFYGDHSSISTASVTTGSKRNPSTTRKTGGASASAGTQNEKENTMSEVIAETTETDAAAEKAAAAAAKKQAAAAKKAEAAAAKKAAADKKKATAAAKPKTTGRKFTPRSVLPDSEMPKLAKVETAFDGNPLQKQAVRFAAKALKVQAGLRSSAPPLNELTKDDAAKIYAVLGIERKSAKSE